MPGVKQYSGSGSKMRKNYDYIIVGAGLCGLVLARELSEKNKKVLILEKGGFVNGLGTVFHAPFFYDKWALSASKQGLAVYRFIGVGGTSVVSCGNAIEFTDEEYNRIGIDFKGYLSEAKRDASVKDDGLPIGPASARITEVANMLGHDMRPMPKFSLKDRCPSCGNCALGCRYESKWTSRERLKGIDKESVELITGFHTNKILKKDGSVIGVEGRSGISGRRQFLAPIVILSAGGIGTPIILQNSGIDSGDNLFVDIFNVTYGISEDYNQRNELSMSSVCDKYHKSDGFVIAPFVDSFAAFIPGVNFRHMLNAFKIGKMMGIMTKIADESTGRVYSNGTIDKSPTVSDLNKLNKGSKIAADILIKCGVDPKSIFVGKPRGAHPGGTAGIGRVVDNKLETRIKNLYVCDASVLPFAPGLPPMLSLIAMTKWFGKKVLEK